MSEHDMRVALNHAYQDPTDYFSSIEPIAVASGSVACVYRAVRPDESAVALKVRRPGIEAAMRQDLSIIEAFAPAVARLPIFANIPVVETVQHMSTAIVGQLDFGTEAASLTRAADTLRGVPRIWVPRVDFPLCRDGVIAMEYIDGLNGRPSMVAPAFQKRFAESALLAIYELLFVDGFVHCDLHPGNLNFTSTGQIVILDTGFSFDMSDELRRLFAEFFMNMAIGRGLKCAEIVVESASAVNEGANLNGFMDEMSSLVERNYRLPAEEFSLISFAAEMFDLQRTHGVRAAPELIFPLLALLVIEGTIRTLNPKVDFQEVAKPVINRALWSAHSA